MKKISLWLCAAICFAAVVSVSDLARADHRRLDPVFQLADSIHCQTTDLRSGVRTEFRHSSISRQLNQTSNDLRNRANQVRSLALSGGCRIRMGQELDSMGFLLNDLEFLMRTARARSAKALDRPLGCTRYLDVQVAQLRQSIFSLRSFLMGRGNRFGTFGHFDLPPIDRGGVGFFDDRSGYVGLKPGQVPIHGYGGNRNFDHRSAGHSTGGGMTISVGNGGVRIR